MAPRRKKNQKSVVEVSQSALQTGRRYNTRSSMAPPKKTYLRKKKKNHKFVVKVLVPKPSDFIRRIGRCQEERLKKKKKTETGKKLEFSDFPADIVENILDRLYSADRIRFGSTCKNNLSFVTSNPTTKHHSHRYEFRTIDRIPWLAEFCPFNFQFRLFEPLHLRGRPHYVTYEIRNPKEEELFSGSYDQLKASRKGWFICLWPKQDFLTSFLLFSPFNKRIIKLPDLDHNCWTGFCSICHAAFSSDPSSPDCVYFFLSQDGHAENISIRTLHQRSRKWKTKDFDNLTTRPVSIVVYHEGCFFCLFDDGHLAAYDVLRQTLDVIIPSSPVTSWDSTMLPVEYHMLVCEGKLLLAYVVDPPDSGCEIEKLRCGLFEFSSSTRMWVRRTSLGNHALFLGAPTSFSVPVSSSQSSYDDNISDRMYFYRTILFQFRPIYYSFKDGRCHVPKGGGYWSSTGVERRIWIEPPLSPSELA